MAQNTIGVLLMAYGTPSSLDEVEEYYTHIRRGHKPSSEQLQDLIDRYQAIGGLSPLNEITRKQAGELEKTLNQKQHQSTGDFRVYLGMKHSKPFISDIINQMASDGISQAIGMVLAPHYSVMSVGNYIKTAEEAISQHQNVKMNFVKSWHLHPMFIDGIAKRVENALDQFGEHGGNLKVIFSAHSLPKRILQLNDPYPQQLRETAQAVADRLNLSDWTIAWQSAGQTAEPWIGPDILDVIQSLHEDGYSNLVSCPVGFVSDHLEVLYDIDIECQALCKKRGVKLIRTQSLNASPDFIETLADIIVQHMVGE